MCRRHPAADRPLIDYDVILMMEPLTMLGALLGSMVLYLDEGGAIIPLTSL